jgi:hypothetical protein
VLHCQRVVRIFCMTMFCSEDVARVENLHLGQSVTSHSILFCSLISTQHKRFACKRARENHEKSERLSPFLQLVRSNLMLFSNKCCPQSGRFPPLNSVCMSYLFLSYLELICCNIKQSKPIL